MAEHAYTISQASRLVGLPVRRIRFYSDQGLLPLLDRTGSGYRLFDESDLVRLGLISALRDAGLSLKAIRTVLARGQSVGDVLTLRLAEIEAQISSQRRIAAAIRMALRSSEPNPEDLRRIWMMTHLSNVQHVATVERFLEQVVEGSSVDPKWKDWMLRMSAPNLPDDPSSEQLDAWLELSAMLVDPAFIAKMRKNAEDSAVALDAEVFKTMSTSVLAKANDAMDRGLEPSSPQGKAIAEEYLAGWARATNTRLDEPGLQRMKRKHLEHQPNMRRYWALVSILNGLPGRSEPSQEWLWIEKAALALLADA
ncbi:MerR family transcriptional regulator [Aureimonas fodinaquatilis]|uniref:MerR family transcriptional regulator n=1 Tax=Aureimonas fodinaquatilis TaxID=2565783 RepID=A0A5B0DT06_9HYPH|nr:MerR family transcriptional regulator [Aureimonas fodinaquatilis]KAA0968891.1 MerR family transcriptional regulator [Aureimonas fodinaquatilis]